MSEIQELYDAMVEEDRDLLTRMAKTLIEARAIEVRTGKSCEELADENLALEG